MNEEQHQEQQEQQQPVAVPLRLRVSRKEAGQQLQNQIKIGRAIKGQRIRDRWELDQARAEKQEWVRRSTETLEMIFNQPTVAEKYNAWAAPILPEYAEIDLFIGLFADEMGQRLEKLQNLLKNLDSVPEPPGSIAPTAASAAAAAATDGAPTGQENSMKAQTAPGTAAAPASSSSSSSSSSGTHTITGVLIVRASQAAVTDAVSKFLSQLGIGLTTIDCSAAHAPVADALSRHDAAFAVVVASSEQVPSDAGACGEYLFDLGCCVGRLGTHGVCCVHPTGAHATDSHGVQHIAIDSTDGWQLQLARHLRRGGVDIDLNKLL